MVLIRFGFDMKDSSIMIVAMDLVSYFSAMDRSMQDVLKMI